MKRETLQELHRLSKVVEDAKEHASELLRTAQDRYNHRTHTVERKDGGAVELTEKTMWDEVFYLGHGCESGKVLTTIHPEVFEAYKKQDEAAEELKKFCILELGVDYTRMSLSDYTKLTEALVDLMLEERKIAQLYEVTVTGDNGTPDITHDDVRAYVAGNDHETT